MPNTLGDGSDSDDVSPYRVSALHLTNILNYCENTKYIVKKQVRKQ